METCSLCGDRVCIPPGVYYRDDPYCKRCADTQARNDLDEEVLVPLLDSVEDGLRNILGDD